MAVFNDPKRRVLLVAGAGFDPRATHVFSLLHSALGDRLRVFLFREERPRPDRELLRRAERQLAIIQAAGVQLEIAEVQIFSVDNAPVGGREAAARLAAYKGFEECTDIVVDFSALSLGVSFPVTKLLLGLADTLDANLHAMAVDSRETESRITSVPTDKATPVHGFVGEWGLDGSFNATRLWLPLLIEGGKTVLDRIYTAVAPNDTCPILPFPSKDPRRGDRLLVEYWDEIDRVWQIGSQNLIYAAESDPVDLYRSILRVDDVRRGVFADLGGSLTVLSPLGTKVMAIGAFMAAVEREFPVFYVEAHGFSIPPDVPDIIHGAVDLVHVWLAGEAYTMQEIQQPGGVNAVEETAAPQDLEQPVE